MKSRLLAVSVGLFLTIAFGCGKSDPTGGDAPPPPTPTGNAVFDKNCLGCHAASEASAGMKKSGPNLSKVGAKQSVDWLADHVKNPKSHKPESKMPEFASKLSADEIKSVSEFMAGLK